MLMVLKTVLMIGDDEGKVDDDGDADDRDDDDDRDDVSRSLMTMMMVDDD